MGPQLGQTFSSPFPLLPRWWLWDQEASFFTREGASPQKHPKIGSYAPTIAARELEEVKTYNLQRLFEMWSLSEGRRRGMATGQESSVFVASSYD